SCMAFTGLNSNLVECAICNKPCYNPIKFANSQGKEKFPRLVTTLFPLGPQLQVLYHDTKSAEEMEYQQQQTQKIFDKLNDHSAKQSYSDFLDGKAYREAVHDGRIRNDDIVVMMSIDGAQLYQSKQSNCWLYIWVIYERSPDNHY
ncbi:uncharacterized protein EDB93DRAFT_1051892, partial [Suillus bovinus]|uniref:uncharacterized protein n=1 Tax=Suillus bovinus TaxID=48563 RepID=UPI001B8699FF